MGSQPIHKATIPSSGEELARIGLGTYKTFDIGKNAADTAPLKEVLKTFYDLGGRLIDSSPMYGAAEERVGDLAEDLKLVNQLFMATKVWTSGQAAGVGEMERSLKFMRRKTMDLMQIHNLVDWKTQLATLRKWKDLGRIRYIGITHYSPSAFTEMEKILKDEKLDFIQIPYSLAETRAGQSLIPLAAKQKVAVIANEPFAHGALFQKVKGKTLPGWVEELGIKTWAQYFLKFILASPEIQFAIPATRRLHHLQDNMQAAFGPMPTLAQKERMLRDFASLE